MLKYILSVFIIIIFGYVSYKFTSKKACYLAKIKSKKYGRIILINSGLIIMSKHFNLDRTWIFVIYIIEFIVLIFLIKNLFLICYWRKEKRGFKLDIRR